MLAGLTFGDRSALEQEHLAEARENKERELKGKKHKKERSKKHKKAKLKKHKEKGHSTTGSDPSDSGFDDELLKQQQQADGSGVRRPTAATGRDAVELHREDWMTVPMARSQSLQQEQPQQEQLAQPDEPPIVGGLRYRNSEQAIAAEQRAAAREAAVTAAGGGRHGPISAAAGVTWRMKAVQRAQQLATEQGRDMNAVLTERWGSAAEIAKGLIDVAAAAGGARHPGSSHRPASDRYDGAVSPHYLSDVRSQQTAMKHPTGLSSSKKLSWRRPGPAEPTRGRDRASGGSRNRDEGRYTARDRSRDSLSAGNRDHRQRERHSRGSPEPARRASSPVGGSQQQQHAGGQLQGSRAVQGGQEGHDRRRAADSNQDRSEGRKHHNRQQQQGYRSEKVAWREQQQESQQSEVVKVLKAVAGHINTYSNDGSFLKQFSAQQQQQTVEGDEQGYQIVDSTANNQMQQKGQGQYQGEPGLFPTAAASGSNRSTAELLRAKLAGRSAAAGGINTVAAGPADNKTAAEGLRARLSGQAVAAGNTAAAADGHSRDKVVQLPLIDASGRAAPGAFGRESAAEAQRRLELAAGGCVSKRVQRYGADRQRERYFGDDDCVDLQTLVKRARHGDDAMDLDRTMASNIAVRSRFKEADLDADAEYDNDAGLDLSEPRRKRGDVEQQRKRERQRQITQYNRAQRLEDRCSYCFSSALRPKELVVAVGQATYLSLVQRGRLVEGHCCIVPAEHIASTRQVDDNTWTEIRNFQKCLIRMFMEAGKEVLFLETAISLGTHRNHAIIECIPVDQEVFAQAPMYFKKALQEAESEWSQHASKAVIDTKAKGLRGSIPPNFPYMYIQFGYANGFVHVIDNESRFDKDLGRQVVVGLLKLPAELMHRKQRADAPEVQANMAAAFRQQFGPFDWTKALD